MSIKVNDTVKVVTTAGYLAEVNGQIGKVVNIYDHYNAYNLAIVEFPNDVLTKIPLDALVKVEPEKQEASEGIKITREQFQEYAESVSDPFSFVNEGTNVGIGHFLMGLTAKIVCERMEKLLFGDDSGNA